MVRRPSSARGERGYSLLEVVVMMSIFTALLGIFFVLTAEMRKWEQRLPVNYMRHPQVAVVMARLRRDVLDAHVHGGKGAPYVEKIGTYENDAKTLIFQTIVKGGGLQTVVWDFSEPGVVRRIAYTASMQESMWVARGLPVDFSKEVRIHAVEFDDRPYGVRIVAKGSDGRTSIEQILQPRAYQEPK